MKPLPSHRRFRPDALHRPGRAFFAGLLAVVVALQGGRAGAMPAAAKGVVETGAPSFVVLGPEALGLSTSPVDFHLLPDGRMLVVSQRELAFGDGVRWETFRSAEDLPPIRASVAVDHDGQVYSAGEGGMARIELSEGARWHYVLAAKVPLEGLAQNTPLVSVAPVLDQWYWYGGDGAIVSWRPGQSARVVGNRGAIERIFALGNNIFISDQASGALLRLKDDGTMERALAAEPLVSEALTCTMPFGAGQLLVGTRSAGLRIFDGKTLRPFGPPGLLNEGHRITDLCPAGEGYFAASIDTVGIVFFDREGRTVQVLGRSLDHRLARAEHLRYAANGVLWALLNDGLARVEFPSPISHFEPLLASGLSYAEPLRHAGELWIQADGQALQGVYDAGGRLESFTNDTPPGHYLFTLTEVDGQLFGCNDEGIYVYETSGWQLAVAGIVNARIGVARSVPEGMFYVARGEYGMIQKTATGYTARRIPLPELGDSYNATVDAAGIGWLELGMSRVGRLDPAGGHAVFRIFGADDGLPHGWVESYLLDGVARFHVGNHLSRFDDARGRFTEDTEMLARIPQLANAGGRPVTDHQGRLWYTADGATQLIDRSAGGGNRSLNVPRIGFAPTNYTVEEDGVVWMFEKRRLVRVDLRLPAPPAIPLQALITSVQFPATNRELFSPGRVLPSLAYSDNSLAVHFAAPANPFVSPVSFEVMLEGAGTQWVSTGAVGSATFHRLKEGSYVFRVRPVAGGAAVGAEAAMSFIVRPPWFRTPLAWTTYAVGTVGLFVFVTWFTSFLQRRKNERLELLVGQRTAELNATNAQLGRQIQETTEKSAALSVSEDRYRVLNAELEDRVRERTAELSLTNGELQQRESLFRLIVENAPVGISWKRNDLGGGSHLNSTFQRILALPADRLADPVHLANLVHPEDAPQQTEKSRGLGAGEIDSYNLEERFVLPDARIVWGSLSVAVIRDPQGRIIQEIGILEDISARKRSEAELANVHRELLETSRKAGMAEVATGVLHNVGNVLNSVNVSATLVADHVRLSKSANVAKLAVLFEEHQADLPAFLTQDPKGRMIPGYLGSLRDSLAQEQATVTTELDHLRRNIEHIKDIVAKQQSFAKTSGVIETVAVTDLVEDAIRINAVSLTRHEVEVVREFEARPVATLDKHMVMQILINLIRNAKNACDESGRTDKCITVRLTADEQRLRVAVADNGVGIPPENLTRIFAHGFTTKKNGHGFGLHSGALAAKELRGALLAHSAGPGLGATFTLELPMKPETPPHEKPGR